MAKFCSSNMLDQGPNYLKTAGTKFLLIKNYTFGDSYATVVANKLAEVTVTSTDYTLSSSGNNRQVALPTGKSATATATSVGGDNLHFAITNGSSEVIYVTDETTDQVVTTGNTVNFPSLTYTANQPT